jgi:protein-S-isoprenylcysteine O-methyltransferase Ste14
MEAVFSSLGPLVVVGMKARIRALATETTKAVVFHFLGILQEGLSLLCKNMLVAERRYILERWILVTSPMDKSKIGSCERGRLDELYSLESDEKLLHLRLSFEELTDVAQIALREELTRHGLWSAAEISDIDQGDYPSLSDEEPLRQSGENSLAVWEGKTQEEAEVLRHLLQLANITAVALPLQSGNLRTVQVNVDRDDAEKALTILSHRIPEEIVKELVSELTSDAFVIPRCHSCDCTDVTLDSVGATNRWSCGKCGSHWEDPLDGAPVPLSLSPPLSENGLSDHSESEAVEIRASKSNLRSIGVIVLGTALAFIASWVQPWTPLRLLGLCLVVPSEILMIVARLQLGGSFSVRAEARSLVAHGLYSRIQNPIYLFGGVTLVGLILFLDRPWCLIAFLIVIPMQLFRIRREREVLTKKFGESYLQYRKQTWF